ncbi:zinc ribbon domain-containing protein [candidate division TA06 bacterium]|nr:zinc ribbon domain-containing protein [candidate division TA06 bacterium]
MPIYEFECRQCQHKFDQLMRASDPDPKCPECQSAAVEKLFSAFGCKSQNGFVSSSSKSGCHSCSSHNCGSCH